jgi:cell fate regulator YaaT (PSP1 superfamily)
MPKYVARYGAMRMLGIFLSPEEKVFSRGSEVIVRTQRGLETATILREAEEPLSQEIPQEEDHRILRAMTPDDHRECRRLVDQQQEEFQRCERIIRKSGLEMNLVKLEHIFGGERIIVYYVADGRVDFRELVKMLASEFQTRIEMRQIGVRDETKLMADFGDCGKEVCCNSHLVTMPPVSMKMAKLQKATLDPTKISGRCGRLKCCLRFEFDVYQEMQSELPRVGRRVQTPDGPGKVVGQEILRQQVQVELEDHLRKLFPADQVQVLRKERVSDGTRQKRSASGPSDDLPSSSQ